MYGKLLWFFVGVLSMASGEVYRIGVGIADVTGPPAEINMMGYANPSQNTEGIHIRQYSRAFVISDKNGSDVVFVSVDACMTAQIVKMGVIEKLKTKFGGKYTDQNVVISSTHTHSTPGGFLQYLLYVITAKGFVAEAYDALVSGITLSIERAHANIQTGYIYYNEGELLDSSINRSPSSYLKNPESERKRYKYDTDKDMLVLKFVNIKNEPIGMLSWFAVHGTSMNNTNKLISGDNKGYASQLFEAAMNNDALPGKGKFVAAFAQANLGDVSPNTRGPHCLDTGKPCDILTSTCNGKNELCVASGPGKDMFESTKIIGENQFKKAKELFDSANTQVNGPVRYVHQFISMAQRKVQINETYQAKTCFPAMGVSFAAGTTDGPGAFDFKQGSKSINPLWALVRDILKDPSAESKKCQHPKPILLDTGHMDFPYEWDPRVVTTQIVQIGNIIAAAVPGEFTTMSGRRIKDAVKQTVEEYDSSNVTNVKVVIAGLSNTYSSYIATYEEYQAQRYEAASTLYGPHTLQAYIEQFKYLARNIAQDKTVESEEKPPNNLDVAKKYSFHIGVVFDGHPLFQPFGHVLQDAKQSTYKPDDTVSVKFVSGHPNNNLMRRTALSNSPNYVSLESSYLTVEAFNETSKNWDVTATDANWETKFFWKRTNTFLGQSTVTVEWDIPSNVKQGTYRIRHYGHYKPLFEKKTKPYFGTSRKFKVSST